MKRTSIMFRIAVVALVFGSAVSFADVLQPGFNQVTLGSIADATRAFGIGIADFTGDGIADIISGQTNGYVVLFIGNGSGGFTHAGRVVNQAYNNAYGLSVADFNGDNQMDFVLSMTVDLADYDIYNGEIHLYPGNGDGTFQANGSLANPQAGIVIVGDIGEYCAAVTSGDVDGDNDVDIIGGDITASANGRADIILFRNSGNNPSGQPTWSSGEIIVSAENILDPETPPYYPPTTTGSYPHAYGLALGDMDGDGDLDLLVTDRAGYLYVYQNDGSGSFGDINGKPIRYNNVSTGTRPYAYAQLHSLFAPITIACGDFNGDSLVDFVTGGDAAPVIVSTATQFRKLAGDTFPRVIVVQGRIDLGGSVNIVSNKTIIGEDTRSGLFGGQINVRGRNVIFQNLILGPTSPDIMEISGATNVFVHKCEFVDSKDESLSIVRESDFVTVSWCKFHFTEPHSHAFGHLIGNRTDRLSDRGKLHTTMHHNWYGANVRARMPRVRYGQVHLYNNFYKSPDNHYIIGVGHESKIRLENAHFENVNRPWTPMDSEPGEIGWMGLKFVECSEPKDFPNSYAAMFTPPYKYTLDSVEGVKDLVTCPTYGAGNRLSRPLMDSTHPLPDPDPSGTIVEK